MLNFNFKNTTPIKEETEWYKRIEEKFGKPSLSEIDMKTII